MARQTLLWHTAELGAISMSRHQPKMLVYLTGTCFILFLRLATVSRAAPPEYESSYPELMTQALEKVKRGQVAEGETLMREAVQLAEGAGDLAQIYWNAWQLARHRGAKWGLSQQLAWFEIAENALKRRDRTHYKWRGADVPNLIQLLCEKETVLAAQGRRGQAFITCQQATELLHENWGPMESDADLRRAPASQVGILLNLLLDQADHREKAGRIEDAAQLYQRCLMLTERYLKGQADYSGYMGRTANNYGVMLGLVGEDAEEEKWQAEALKFSGGNGRDLIAEANQLRKDSLVLGPSNDLVERLLAKAERLAKARRADSALETRRRAASVLYELGRVEEAEAQFAQVLGEAQAREFRVVAAHALYWRGKARSRAGTPGAEDDFLAALESYRRQGTKPYECRLYQAYADFLQRHGRLEDALSMVNEGVRLNRSMNLVHLRPELLMLKATILEQAGRHSASEAVWAEALELARQTAAYSHDRWLRVRVGYLRYLTRNGRKEELAREMAATHAFVEQSDLSDYQTQAFREFKPEDPAGETVAVVQKAPPVALAPVYTATHTPLQQPAQTWFWLMNPAAVERKGRVSVQGAEHIDWDLMTPTRIDVELQGVQEDTEVAREIVVPADDVLAIRLVHLQPPADGVRITLAWQGESEATAEWQVAGDAGPFHEESTFHQHFAQQNAFFSVALYHEIGAERMEAGLNFRTRGSVPCRVEIYDAESLVLLAVDAQGDGDFGGAGDLLAQDADIDGYPDTDRASQPVVLHVFPVHGESYHKPLDLALDIRIGDEWRPIGLDRLVDMVTVDGP